jgi:hypothetical protein
MTDRPNIHRPNKSADVKSVERSRETIARLMQFLSDNPTTSTFAVRKTQEPFPQDDDEVRFQGWLKSKDLRPPE